MDPYCLVRAGPATHHGSAESYEVDGSVMRLWLTPDAADVLGVPPAFEVDPGTDGAPLARLNLPGLPARGARGVRQSRNDERPAIARALLVLAVAEGFEPSEGCPSRAFEARSFGRSDTPPRETILVPAEAAPIRRHPGPDWAAAVETCGWSGGPNSPPPQQLPIRSEAPHKTTRSGAGGDGNRLHRALGVEEGAQ